MGMTKEEFLKKITIAFSHAQALIHILDILPDFPLVKQSFKRATNNYLKELEKFVSLNFETGDTLEQFVGSVEVIERLADTAYKLSKFSENQMRVFNEDYDKLLKKYNLN